MTGEPALTIVVAVKEAEANLSAILTRLAPLDHPDVELIVCVAGPLSPASMSLTPASARIVPADPASLVPHLWRDGIRLARAPRIALTTANCVPAADWITRLRHADKRAAGVGGVIDNDAGASAADWAVFFLRYSAFAPPHAEGDVAEIAADNAVYDRDAILEQQDLLAEGFWEPSFHHRFRAAGKTLRLDPTIVVTHVGRGSPMRFIRHRHAHGRHYGRDRAAGRSTTAALALALASPLVPVVTLGRIVGRVLRRPRYYVPFARATPWLAIFVLAWSSGEARGYWNAAVAGIGRRPVARENDRVIASPGRSTDGGAGGLE